MGKRGYKPRGRGGRGGHAHNRPDSDFGDDFIAFGEFVDVASRGRGRGRGAFVQMPSVFVPPAGRASPRGGYRGARPSTPRGRGSITPRGRGDFQPRGRGDFTPRGRGRGDAFPRGRGRGFAFQSGSRDSGNEFEGQQNRLLEPITFVRARLTARTLFQEEEEIFKAEVVDVEEGDVIPTADFVEAAFASQQDAEEDDEEYSPDDNDLQDTATTTIDPTRSYTPPVASSSKQLPKLDISSAVSLATALKDAALTPREEHFVPVSPALSKAIIKENTPIDPVAPDSNSDSEDVVLFIPQPRTPLRPMTPLPLLAAPGPSLGVAPSPIRPSPLAMSFRSPLQEDEEMLEAIPEASGKKLEDLAENTHDIEMGVLDKTKPADNTTITTTTMDTDADIPTINFEDLSSAMFVDTTPARVELSSKTSKPIHTEKARGHILGTSLAKSSPKPSTPNLHATAFESTSRSTTTQATEQIVSSGSTIQATSVVTESIETVTTDIPAKPPTPNFHTMKFTFTPRTEASRARRAPPGDGRHGLGFKPKSTQRVPREGDSDLDWGDDGPPKSKMKAKESQDKEDEDEESDGDHGMVEDIDSATMLKFLKGVEAQEWKTMDDINDEEMLRQEDEDEDEEDESESSEDEDSDEDLDEDEEELNRIIAAAEAELLNSDEESDDDLDESFRTRLSRMRKTPGRNGKGKGKGKGKGRAGDDSDDDEIQMSGFSWAEKDEAYIAAIQEQLEEELFLKRERKRGVISPPLSPASRGKSKHVPPELQAQWERDRSKKAENKRLRALQRQIAAQESPKRGSGRKSKASFMFNSSGAVSSLPAIEPKLRAFVANLGMKTMALQAMDKESRRRVHLLAECFGIKTDSKGSGTGRYITLIRTSRTGLAVDEAKIRRLVRAAEEAEDTGMAAFNRAYYRNDGERAGGGKSKIKTRDGEEVGRTAAKIGVDNIGHQLLSKMGWSEGDRIGKSGGIADPLVAVMKSTKLGLGATRK
ncbi:hypothetical protein FRC09_019096 [Ceratobasidium sp. 395]|nr:hypothetical protein FRC09_019096 [Ceratobasidium sp. 395]